MCEALFMYDYFLTLPQEIKCIWRRKWSTATVLFLVNRYVVMCNRGFRMIQAVSWQGQFEHTADRVMFAAIRMYAIWNRDRKVFACVLALGLIYPIVNTVSTLYHSLGWSLIWICLN
ncbi:hypothetical protein BDY19DRAFT_900028 [Irpex rosettiformis]|uniref:Uncharacterized protein n=1 Tax=Irpex rosettiformis TaxID=378272 RepID=A0ACB8TNR9_9APHY|nr:hypothetical protein BDY19DRAFT_900028 [Irpex rosettiformis]